MSHKNGHISIPLTPYVTQKLLTWHVLHLREVIYVKLLSNTPITLKVRHHLWNTQLSHIFRSLFLKSSEWNCYAISHSRFSISNTILVFRVFQLFQSFLLHVLVKRMIELKQESINFFQYLLAKTNVRNMSFSCWLFKNPWYHP